MTSIISSATSTIEAGLASVSDQINASLAAEKKADPLDPVTGSTAGKEGGGGDKVKSPIEEKLEGFFAHDRNEDKKALKEKGILKDDKVSPVLQAKQEELKRAQLQNNLDHQIKARPSPEELIKAGVLNKDENPKSPV